MDIIKGILAHTTPLVIPVLEKTAKLVFGQVAQSTVYLFHHNVIPVEAKARLNEMERAAKYYNFNRTFLELDVGEEIAFNALRYFKVLISDLPVVVIEHNDLLAKTSDITEQGTNTVLQKMFHFNITMHKYSAHKS